MAKLAKDKSGSLIARVGVLKPDGKTFTMYDAKVRFTTLGSVPLGRPSIATLDSLVVFTDLPGYELLVGSSLLTSTRHSLADCRIGQLHRPSCFEDSFSARHTAASHGGCSFRHS